MSAMICREIPNLVQIGQMCIGFLLEVTRVSCCWQWHVTRQYENALLCFLDSASYIYYIVYVRQQYTDDLLLRFHGNSGYANAPYCHVVHTFPILLEKIAFCPHWWHLVVLVYAVRRLNCLILCNVLVTENDLATTVTGEIRFFYGHGFQPCEAIQVVAYHTHQEPSSGTFTN